MPTRSLFQRQLCAALVLKFDRFDAPINAGYFIVGVSSVLMVFSVLGSHRAVIRFMGSKVMLTVLAGVSLSVLILAKYDRLGASPQLPSSALAIFWSLALL